MAGLKYANYIVTGAGTPPELPAQDEMIEKQRMAGNYADRVFSTSLHDGIVKGSFFVMGAWMVGLHGTEPVITDPAHTHAHDEVLGFTGSDPSNFDELGGEIEIWLEDEKYIIDKSCLIFIPKGMKHGPLSVRKFTRPFFGYAAALTGGYSREWEGQ